ncbi:MAG TPA: formate dehydrogenase accessory protein FdhE [Terriglobia bacterium]
MTKPVSAPSRKWDRRIERARALAGQYPFATEILTFYSKLTAFQQGCDSRLQSTLGASSAGARNGQLSPDLNLHELEALLPQFRSFLSFLGREAPSALAGFATSLENNDPGHWARLLTRFWRRTEGEEAGGVKERPAEAVRPETRAAFSDGGLSRFTALAFLQPYVEYLAGRADMHPPAVRRPVCSFCGSKPLAGVLRPEGDGAKRSLVCSFCYTEWDYRRIACPACEEFRDERMCVYTASQFEHVRVEACETCRTYIKTVDLTKNGLALPEVDELAAIPLTLWADGQGYTKLSRNIFGS